MITDLNEIFSTNAKHMKKSVIRELLKLTRRPEVISFAGGLPDPAAFPVEEVAEITAHVLRTQGATALQYGPTEGDPKLKEELIAHHEREDGIQLKPENILITVASQQGLDLTAKVFVNRDDNVIVGLPTYVGGLGAFTSYGARMIGIELDDDGMRMDLLERKLERMHKKRLKPKFIYVVPDFQNPAGITMSEARRRTLIDLAHKYDVLIVEDSPYKELRFEGESQQSIFALDGTGHVIGLHTFSKILFPGMRLGWVIGDEAIIQKMVIAKQATALCTPPFTQAIIAEFAARRLNRQRRRRLGSTNHLPHSRRAAARSGAGTSTHVTSHAAMDGTSPLKGPSLERSSASIQCDRGAASSPPANPRRAWHPWRRVPRTDSYEAHRSPPGASKMP